MNQETATIAELVLEQTLFGISMGHLGRYGLVVIMLTMGMHLRLTDFKLLFNRPVSVITGLAGQMLFLPLVAHHKGDFAPHIEFINARGFAGEVFDIARMLGGSRPAVGCQQKQCRCNYQ